MKRVFAWLGSKFTRGELLVTLSLTTLAYLIYGTVIKPVAVDFNIYRFAGYALQNGISPYDETPAANALAERYHTVPFALPYRYPPVFSQAMSVLVNLPYPVLRILSTLSLVVALFASIWFMSRTITESAPRYLLIATLIFFPILTCIAAGQMSLYLLAVVTMMIYLSQEMNNRVQFRNELISGTLLGISFVLKPVLWPLGLWALFHRRWNMLLGCALAVGGLITASVITLGIQPWLDYANILRSFASPDPYIENQSLVGVAARLTTLGLAQTIQVVIPLLTLGIWFAFLRHLPPSVELASLAGIAVLISPVAWYYYFVLLLPTFWVLVRDRPHINGVLVFVISAYFLIQVHGFLWHLLPDGSFLVNLGFVGMVVILTIVILHVFQLERLARVAPISRIV